MSIQLNIVTENSQLNMCPCCGTIDPLVLAYPGQGRDLEFEADLDLFQRVITSSGFTIDAEDLNMTVSLCANNECQSVIVEVPEGALLDTSGISMVEVNLG